MKKIVVLTGAGISAESGIKTFRDADGLWENHRLEEVATPEAWRRNPELVLRFYNERRRQLHTVRPNEGHLALAALEKHHRVHIITQNVDDLHERAGSTSVLHLHGELLKARSERHEHPSYPCTGDLALGDLCPKGTHNQKKIGIFAKVGSPFQHRDSLSEPHDVGSQLGTFRTKIAEGGHTSSG
jgi:NAD-dependent deacetylase